MERCSKIVIFDIDIQELLCNRVFDRSEAIKISHTYLPLCYLAEEARKRGISFVTPDVFLEIANKPNKSILITPLASSFTDKLIEIGATPLILLCQESPFIATRFYFNLKNISSKYHHSFVFSGMKKKLAKKTNYNQMHFPMLFEVLKAPRKPFNEKKFAVMICDAKGIENWNKNILLKLMYGFGVREINNERRKIISYFSKIGGLDLFGRGWLNKIYSDLPLRQIKKVYQGVIPFEEKNELVGQYKFNFCFENSVFPGYVTEKIFDAMLAGSVPVYLGAPDIEQFVDQDAIIDMRKFSGLDELSRYLSLMSSDEYQGYLDSIKKYLASASFEKFSHRHFSNTLLDLIEQEFAKS